MSAKLAIAGAMGGRIDRHFKRAAAGCFGALHQVKGHIKGIGVTIPAAERRTPEYLTKFVPAEIERWARPIKASGVSAD